MGAIHGKGRFQCSGCHQGFSWRLDLANHLQQCKKALHRCCCFMSCSLNIAFILMQRERKRDRFLVLINFKYFTGRVKTSSLSTTCWRPASCVDTSCLVCTVRKPPLSKESRNCTTQSDHLLRCVLLFCRILLITELLFIQLLYFNAS